MDRDFNPKDGEWFYFMNQYAEALMKQGLSGTEFQVLFCIIRYAWGFKKSYADLIFKQITDYTDLSKGTASKAIKKLTDRNMISISFLQETNRAKRYRINSKISTWKTVSYRKPVSSRKQSVSSRKPHLLKTNKDKLFIRDQAKAILDKLNECSGKSFQHKDSSLDPIIACLNRGHTKEECLYVVENKWLDPDFPLKYYRPTTLFRKSLFEGYLNENGRKPKPTRQQAKQQRIVAKYERKYSNGQRNDAGDEGRSNAPDDGTVL